MNPVFLLEFLKRFVYYRLHLNKLTRIVPKNKKKTLYKLTLSDIENALIKAGVEKGDSIMVHSSLSHINATAKEVIDLLKNYIGPSGNILMPTHPRLVKANDFEDYDVDSSISYVGFLTEYFRKSEGVKRSLHPFSSIAAWGKDRDWFLENNLNENKPLPHGIYSPYYKFVQKNGITILIGVGLNRATIRHVAEEVLDLEFPLKNFFKEYKVRIRQGGKDYGIYKVRKANLKKSQLFISRRKILKEWNSIDAYKKIDIRGNPIYFVKSKKVTDFLIDQAKRGDTCYPLAPKK